MDHKAFFLKTWEKEAPATLQGLAPARWEQPVGFLWGGPATCAA